MKKPEEWTRSDAIEQSLKSWMETHGINQGLIVPGDETDVARFIEIGLNNWQHNQRLKRLPCFLHGFTRIHKGKRGWYYTPWTKRFGHGGWFVFDPRTPLATARWLRRFWNGPSR